MTPSFDQLPYTVLDTILGLDDLSLGYDADLDLRRLGKRTLNTHSMTCRLWCSRIRPRLFAIITLRSREDILSLLSFSVEAKLLIQDVIMEETIPGIPWTHLMYMAIRARGFSPKMSLHHQFNGAPTCLAHPLQPFNHSLPRILPAFVKDQSPISLSNLVLPSFNDLLVFTSRLCSTIYWELDFSDISWLAGIDCIGVPASVTRKNRALCSLVGMRSCAERWPFVWLCITTCPPQPNRALYVDPGEVPTLMRLTKCLTTPTDGRVCGHTELYRNDSVRSPSAFALSIRCMELPPHNCTPTTRFHFRNGRLEKVRLELVAPEEGGFALTLHDWEQFDSLCAGCEGLQEVRIQVDGEQASVSVFVKEAAGLLRRLVRQGKVVFVS